MSVTETAKPTHAIYRGHIAELDAIRGVGIGLVLVNHFWPQVLGSLLFSIGQLGWIAMDSFFVLSGFLITGILLDTRSRSDYFSNYYIRRSLRIFPLYYLVLLAILFMSHFSMGGGGAENTSFVRQWGSPAWFFFYLGNFRIAYKHSWPTIAGYGPLWSLQIEEQFYLLLPLAVRWMRRENLTRLLWGMVILSPVVRILFYLHDPGNPFPQFVLLPCHMEGLALGALIAVRFRSGPWILRKRFLAALTLALLVATCIASFAGKPILVDQLWSSPFNLLAGISLSSWGCASLLLLLISFRGSPYTRLLRTTPIAYLAKISYGIYLLHRLVSRFARWLGNSHLHLPPDSFARFAVVVGLSILLASISWYAFESPLMRLKDRIAPSHQPDRLPGN